MLERVGGLMREVGEIVRSSHERWDGGGYPDGLRGAAIPLEARIVSACDAFNAMTTTRSYRQAMPLTQAIAELRSGAGTQFDPEVVLALMRLLDGELLRGARHRRGLRSVRRPYDAAASSLRPGRRRCSPRSSAGRPRSRAPDRAPARRPRAPPERRCARR